MKHILLSAAAASLVAGSAIAGGYTAPVVEAPVIAPVAPVVSDWTGFYAGVQYGAIKFYDVFDGESFLEDEGSAYGVHAGYLRDFGQFVLGAELDYNKIDWESDIEGDLLRLRARAGYDLGRVLPYLTAGVARFTEDFGYSDTGLSYGVGVDVKATERFSLGLEYSRSSFDNGDLELGLMQLRAAYRF